MSTKTNKLEDFTKLETLKDFKLCYMLKNSSAYRALRLLGLGLKPNKWEIPKGTTKYLRINSEAKISFGLTPNLLLVKLTEMFFIDGDFYKRKIVKKEKHYALQR